MRTNEKRKEWRISKAFYHRVHKTIQRNKMLFANNAPFPFTISACLPWSFASCVVWDVLRPSPTFLRTLYASTTKITSAPCITLSASWFALARSAYSEVSAWCFAASAWYFVAASPWLSASESFWAVSAWSSEETLESSVRVALNSDSSLVHWSYNINNINIDINVNNNIIIITITINIIIIIIIIIITITLILIINNNNNNTSIVRNPSHDSPPFVRTLLFCSLVLFMPSLFKLHFFPCTPCGPRRSSFLVSSLPVPQLPPVIYRSFSNPCFTSTDFRHRVFPHFSSASYKY